MNGEIVLSASLLTTVTIMVIKWAVRKVKKDESIEFKPVFYDLTLPFFTAVWGVVLGETVYDLQSLISWAVAIVLTLVIYNGGVKPYMDWRNSKA